MRLPTSRPVPAALTLIAAACVLAGSCSTSKADGGERSSTTTTSASTSTRSDDTLAGPIEVQLVDTEAEVDKPIAAVAAPDGDAMLIAQRAGLIVSAVPDGTRLVVADEPVLDLTEDVVSTEGERGLLGIAVSPDGKHLYASYTDGDPFSLVDEFTLAEVDGNWTADPDSRRTLIKVKQPYWNHNGGHIEFGPDGLLYLGLGDGGAGGDPEGRAQDPSTALGKMLRFDPADPPKDPADAAWASGLRNPWRFTFDPATGDVWIADVGQDTWEEINWIPADEVEAPGRNFGWDIYEGTDEFADPNPASGGASDGPFTEPVLTYGRDRGCSITGGVVYRGERIPAMDGAFLFADLCEGGVRALQHDDDLYVESQLSDHPWEIVSFATDDRGEVLVISLGKGIFRLEPA